MDDTNYQSLTKPVRNDGLPTGNHYVHHNASLSARDYCNFAISTGVSWKSKSFNRLFNLQGHKLTHNFGLHHIVCYVGNTLIRVTITRLS